MKKISRKPKTINQLKDIAFEVVDLIHRKELTQLEGYIVIAIVNDFNIFMQTLKEK